MEIPQNLHAYYLMEIYIFFQWFDWTILMVSFTVIVHHFYLEYFIMKIIITIPPNIFNGNFLKGIIALFEYMT
jgi:hypothetical protein